MTLYFAEGSDTTSFTDDQLRDALQSVFAQLGERRKALILPPDYTRLHSQAGKLTCLTHQLLRDNIADIMPALGTHDEMELWQRQRMFPTVPDHLFRVHDWRRDVVTLGTVPGQFVADVTEGIWDKPWPAQVNRLVWEGGHDLILSIGQVVPHEVIGMANYNKNVFVGTGGDAGINESHFIGAAYGMERMMGRADTPLRRILNEAQRRFCKHLPLVFVLTVVSADSAGRLHVRGLFVGDDEQCFLKASELSLRVNFTVEDEEPTKVVAYLDPEEFHSTWLGNKAVYRTRMLIADGGELVVLAPGVRTFGEDRSIDRLIRRYGYLTTPEVLAAVEQNEELRENLSAAAHLIHGSSENRFRITYCPGHLSREEVEGVGYAYRDLQTALREYPVDQLREGWNDVAGQRIYFVGNPALGLWASRRRIEDVK